MIRQERRLMSTYDTGKYYTTMEHLVQIFDQSLRKYAFNAKDISEYEDWKKKLRGALCDITGINKMQKCALAPQILETSQMDGYRRDKILLQTESNIWMPCYILIPDDMKTGEKRA